MESKDNDAPPMKAKFFPSETIEDDEAVEAKDSLWLFNGCALNAKPKAEKKDFDPELVLSKLQPTVPVNTLQTTLANYLLSLCDELVNTIIINEFWQFAKLIINKKFKVDESKLVLIRENIEHVRESTEASVVSIIDLLKQKHAAASVRKTLEQHFDMFHGVSKIEKLLEELLSFWPQDVKTEISSDVGVKKILRETQNLSIILHRIANEMNRLKCYTAHGQNTPFAEKMEKRLQSASERLDAFLECSFVNGIKWQDVNVIYICLHAYVATGNTKNAEHVFQTIIMAPLVKRIITCTSSESELEHDYQRIKQTIDANCKLLLEITYAENSGLDVFDFLSNSILKEVLLAIQKRKPGVFSPGRPKEFLRNYESSLRFLDELEGYCCSKYGVAKFRSHDVYSEFTKQWNIRAYFSLRFQEIAGALEGALEPNSLFTIQSQRNHQDVTLKQSVALLESLRLCWKEDIFVLSCADKFLRLSLQLVSRYLNWVSNGLAAQKVRNAETALASLEGVILIIHDVKCLEKEICGDYLQNVLALLSTCSADVLRQVAESIRQAGQSLQNLESLIIEQVKESLLEKSAEDLRQLKKVLTICTRTSKSLPFKKPYASRILHPLKALLDGERAMTYMTGKDRNDLLLDVSVKITGQIDKLVCDFVCEVRKAESFLQNLREGVLRRDGVGLDAGNHNVLDVDWICMQLFIFIQEYGRELSSLGVDAASISEFRSSLYCVALPAKKSMIDFHELNSE